jgi:predicted Zn-dependent peptidase
MAADDPDDVCGEQFFTAIFGDSPLARPIGGTVADIEGADRSSVVEHYADRYQTRDLIVTAAGDVDHDEIVRLVLDSLVGWQIVDGSPEARRSQVPASIADRKPVLVTERQLEQVALLVGTEGIVAGDVRRNEFNVLLTVLGGGSSSRLFQEIREKRGLAYSVDAFPVFYSDAGAIGFGAGCAPAVVLDVAQLMLEGLTEMSTITDAELARAKGQILGSSTLALESMDARMNRLARAEFLGEYRDLDEVERLLATVSREAVAALAGELAAQPISVSAVGAVTPDTFAPLF